MVFLSSESSLILFQAVIYCCFSALCALFIFEIGFNLYRLSLCDFIIAYQDTRVKAKRHFHKNFSQKKLRGKPLRAKYGFSRAAIIILKKRLGSSRPSGYPGISLFYFSINVMRFIPFLVLDYPAGGSTID
ncbi:MAG: hypothetical protein IIY77_04520, partial [Lachnospiraceae bacterium]|nr:hypothetical protein [Lachnospiraceae bacterium]